MGNFFGCATEDSAALVTKVKKERSCTDVLLILAFIAVWGGVIIIASTASKAGGNPAKLYRGQDFAGRICGVDGGVTSQPYLAWPDPFHLDFHVCVTNCNTTSSASPQRDPRFYINYNTAPFLYYCVPLLDELDNNNVNGSSDALRLFNSNSDFNTGASTASRAMGDLAQAWPIFLIGGALAVFFAFVYCWVVKEFAYCLTWSAILFVIIGTFFTSYTLIQAGKQARANKIQGTNDDRADAEYALGIVALVLAVIIVLVVIALRTSINIAIQILVEASKAVKDMPMLLFFPFFPFVCVCAYFLYWIWITLYIMSVTKTNRLPFPTELKTDLYHENGLTFDGNYTAYAWDTSYQKSFCLHFFHLLWNVQFFIYLGYMTLAGAVADWYFTPYRDGQKPRGESQDELSETPVSDSFWRVVKYHLGTVLFGAAIIAIVQFVRAVFEYIKKKSEAANKENTLVKVLMCLIRCCLYCLECCLDKLSKNGFIYSSIYGTSFCASACSAFSLILRNLAKVAAINAIGDWIILIGKLFISLTATGFCGLILLYGPAFKDSLSSIAMPMTIVFIIAWCVGSLFMVVYETAVDSVFLCFLVDFEVNKGGNMRASEALQKLVNEHGAHKDVPAAAAVQQT